MPKFQVPSEFDFPPTAGGLVTKRLGPGAPGTRRWVEHYGKSLVCVRYRQDKALGRRYTTVEIIVDESAWRPPAALVRIAFHETNLRLQAKELGGEWVADRKLWRLSRAAVRTLGLEDRVVENCQKWK